jgi:hypothetical protein
MEPLVGELFGPEFSGLETNPDVDREQIDRVYGALGETTEEKMQEATHDGPRD